MRTARARRFPAGVVEAIRASRVFRLRAGTLPHRFIGIWAVVVEGRVFVRSWSLKPGGWYRRFLKDSAGAIEVAGREITVRALRARGERLKDAVDRAYLQKYSTPGATKYAQDLCGTRSRATTLEIVPSRHRVRAAGRAS